MVKRENLTVKQDNVLRVIYNFIIKYNYSPTVREVTRILGLSSPKSANDHIAVLQKKGYIQKNSVARSITLTEKALWYLNVAHPFQDNNICYLPLLGKIAAGKPIFAQENIEEYIPISKQIMGKAEGQFLLRVQGDSMSGDHIIDGDILVVKTQNYAENGDIVVALIGEETVVKRFYKREGGVIELLSSNPIYEPIIVKEDLGIQGKVIAIFRHVL